MVGALVTITAARRAIYGPSGAVNRRINEPAVESEELRVKIYPWPLSVVFGEPALHHFGMRG